MMMMMTDTPPVVILFYESIYDQNLVDDLLNISQLLLLLFAVPACLIIFKNNNCNINK